MGFVSGPPLSITGTVSIKGTLTSVGTVGKIATNVNVQGSLTSIGLISTIGRITAGTVTISGTTSVAISGTPAVTIASGTVNIGNTPTVKIASGSVSIASGTVSVQNSGGTVIQVGAEMVLLSNTVAKRTGGSFSLTVTQKGYVFAGFLVLYVLPSAATATPYCASLTTVVYSHSSPSYVVRGTLGVAPFGPKTPTPGDYSGQQFSSIIPIPPTFATGTQGKTVQIRIYQSGTVTTGRVMVWGLTANPGVKVRADGRAHPIGTLTAAAHHNGTHTFTLIAAPSTPLRVMLRNITVGIGTAITAFVLLTITRGGSSVSYPLWAKGGFSTGPSWDQGLLCDAATAVKITTTASTAMNCTAIADYDLVV